MDKPIHEHFYPIVDLMVHNSAEASAAEGEPISCKKGCDHCCHLLIEISYEEATVMARWIAEQPAAKQEQLLARIQANAEEARGVFRTHKKSRALTGPVVGDLDIPDSIYDAYFYDKKRPCPMLEDQACGAYGVRPTPCRLHIVTSDPVKCTNAPEMKEDLVESPEDLEDIRDQMGDLQCEIEEDPRWGHFSIMLEATINELIEAGELEMSVAMAS